MMAKSGPKVEVPVTAEMWSKMGKLAFGMEELMPKTVELDFKVATLGSKAVKLGSKAVNLGSKAACSGS